MALWVSGRSLQPLCPQPLGCTCDDLEVLAKQELLLQIVYAVRAKTTLAVDLRNVEENGAKTMAKAFQVRFAPVSR